MFVTDCLAKGLTVAKATQAWMETLSARAEAAREEAATPRKPAGGTRPLSAGDPSGNETIPAGGARAAYEKLLSDTCKERNCSRREAGSFIAKNHPHVLAAFVQEANA